MSSIESLTLLVAQLQQTVLAQADRERLLEARVRALEEDRQRPVPLTTSAPVQATSEPEPLKAHRAKEREQIIATLEQTGWNRVEAARILGIPRRTFYRHMLALGIQKGDTRPGVAGREKARARSNPKKRVKPVG